MSFLRVRASERYLVSKFSFNLNQGRRRVGTAFPHLFFSTTLLSISDKKCKTSAVEVTLFNT